MPAEVTDENGLVDACPQGGAVFGDKGYCVHLAQRRLKKKGCHNAAIKKNNMKGKDRCQDAWLSAMRSPYQHVFSHRNKRVRYRGLKKVQFQVGIRALTFNLKRLMALGIQKITLLPARINPPSNCENWHLKAKMSNNSTILRLLLANAEAFWI